MTDDQYRELRTLMLELAVRIERLELHLRRQDEAIRMLSGPDDCLEYSKTGTPADVDEMLKALQSQRRHTDT